MIRKRVIIWTTAAAAVSFLNIVDVLPDWTTITAVLALALALNARCFARREA